MLPFRFIHSFTNPIFKNLVFFVKQGVNKNVNNLFCVGGWKNNLVALQQNCLVHSIFVSKNIQSQQLNQLKSLVKKTSVQWIQLAPSLISKLNSYGNGNDLFIYYFKSYFENQTFALNNVSNYAFCDHIQNPDNLGAIIRNAAAFNIKGLFVYECASIFNVKTIKASAGNIFNIPIGIINDLSEFLTALKNKNIKLVGLENSLTAKMTSEVANWPISCILVFGNEGHGISPTLLKNLDFSLKIAINPQVESLNVAATAAIIFYELNKQC